MRRVDQPALVRRFRPGNSSGIAEIHRYALAVSQNAHDAVHAVSSEVVATPLEALVVFIAVIFNSSQMGVSIVVRLLAHRTQLWPASKYVCLLAEAVGS